MWCVRFIWSSYVVVTTHQRKRLIQENMATAMPINKLPFQWDIIFDQPRTNPVTTSVSRKTKNGNTSPSQFDPKELGRLPKARARRCARWVAISQNYRG